MKIILSEFSEVSEDDCPELSFLNSVISVIKIKMLHLNANACAGDKE